MKKILLVNVMFVAACTVQPVFTPEQGKSSAKACIEEVQAPGVYSMSPGRPSASPREALPRARAVERLGGTSSGAAAINSCIQRRAIG